jgi:hypothetical protein
MYVIYGVLVIAMLFIFFLPITDYKTVRMKSYAPSRWSWPCRSRQLA